MRKYAGIFIAMLLLVVPALANAFTLTVKVVGGSSANKVDASGGAVKTITGGTQYLYPLAPTTLTLHVAAGSTATVNDTAAVEGATFVASAASTYTVLYTAPKADLGFKITQTDGGSIYVQLPNNTVNFEGASGVLATAKLPVTIQANAGYTIATVTPASEVTFGANARSLTFDHTVSAGDVSATFTQTSDNKTKLLSATLLAPLAGFTGKPVKSSAIANGATGFAFRMYSSTANTGAQNNFAKVAATTNASYFDFTPVKAGIYTVQVTVSGPNSASDVKYKSITVTSLQDYNTSQCTSCHSSSTPAVVSTFATQTFQDGITCQGCHTADQPHSISCATCHADASHAFTAAGPQFKSGYLAQGYTACRTCHTAGAPHTAVPVKTSCIACHDIAIKHVGNVVADNNGVRAITTEFTKWSHHVTGVALQDAHCAACHLEGKVDIISGAVVVDSTKHMVDAKTHLRNADTDADMAWDPAAPNHTTMDNFCMSCHDANGATSDGSIAARGVMVPAVTGQPASALNPFRDTISNKYDKMQRPAVVDASSQFNTGNNSHHAVKGARYSGRTRTASARQIASPTTFANNSSALLQGKRSTIYDAGNFNALYVPLENADGEAAPRTGAASLGDDSTLHCGDCHTVGQWKAGSTVNAAGAANTVAIGAHGSNNEYLLRNTLGTDARHTQNAYTLNASNVVTATNPNGAFLVCYNCHAYKKYGSVYVGTGLDSSAGQPHAGEYANTGKCNGAGNTLPFNGYTTGTATDGTQFTSRVAANLLFETTAASYAGEQNGNLAVAGDRASESMNIFGIQCANCHNSGAANAYGGIHGSANNTNTTLQNVDPSVTGGAYIDGMGNTTKVMRFLPGLGNAMHVPGTLGGFTGGSQATFLRYSTAADKLSNTELGIRNNNSAVLGTTGKPGSYTYTTGAVSNDTNWEQKAWNQNATTVFGYLANGAPISATNTASGAGCYTLGEVNKQVGTARPDRNAATMAVEAPSVKGATGTATELLETWGGCVDHGAPQGGGDHGFVKAIVRPVTY